ncbi:MAG: thiol:disulfide interchange protein, partial [Rhodothermales bacterium]|nr:thiol:disulfide interchange protein [Rhodothermales bacterium]
VNKRTTLRSDEVTDAFRNRRVVTMRADWTNEDPEITRALESLGRHGVPVYALYPGDGSAPVLLPEILTRDIVLRALANLPESRDQDSDSPGTRASL